MSEDLKEIDIEYEGKKAAVVIKKLTFGERNDLLEEVMDIKYIGATPQVKIKQGKLKELTILKSIVKAPFKADIQTIRSLTPELGDKLYDETEKLNRVTEEKKSS